MTRFRPFVGILAVGLLLALSAVCRSAEVPTTADQRHMSQLGSGDSVSIQVFGQPEATNVYVGEDGTISVPLVGNIQSRAYHRLKRLPESPRH